MEEKKKNTGLTICIVIVVCLLVVAAVGYGCYKLGQKSKIENTINNTQNNNKENGQTKTDSEQQEEKMTVLQIEAEGNITGELEVRKYYKEGYDPNYNGRILVSYNGEILNNTLSEYVDSVYANQIDDVIILVFTEGESQCINKYILTFNTDGKLLNNFTDKPTIDYSIDKSAKTINLTRYNGTEKCWCCPCDGDHCNDGRYNVTLKVAGKITTAS